jgi:hypothetical protein
MRNAAEEVPTEVSAADCVNVLDWIEAVSVHERSNEAILYVGE